MKKRMKEEEIEKGDCGPPTQKVLFEILWDLNQAVPDHVADKSQKWIHHFEDGLVVFPANAFDSRLRGDWVPLGSNPTKSQNKKTEEILVRSRLRLVHVTHCLSRFWQMLYNSIFLAGCHVRASAGDLAVHGALIRVCVCVCVCVSGYKLLSHHATNRDQVCFCRQVSTR